MSFDGNGYELPVGPYRFETGGMDPKQHLWAGKKRLESMGYTVIHLPRWGGAGNWVTYPVVDKAGTEHRKMVRFRMPDRVWEVKTSDKPFTPIGYDKNRAYGADPHRQHSALEPISIDDLHEIAEMVGA